MILQASDHGIRVLLINPHVAPSKQYAHFKWVRKASLPTGLGFLAGFLRSKGVAVKILDEQVQYLCEAALENILREFRPHLIGLSCLTPVILRAFELAKTVKNLSPDAWVVLGGLHPTVRPDECLTQAEVDFVIRQEGEETLWELVQSKQGVIKTEDIPGLSFKKNGCILHNPDRPFQKNLNLLPPFPYDLFFQNSNPYRLVYVLTAKGCPYRCTFCCGQTTSGRAYRTFSPQRIAQEVENLADCYGVKSFHFSNPTFLLNKQWAMELCELFIEKKLADKAVWRCSTRADSVTEDALKKMKRAGCARIAFGIETASQRLLDLIKKGETVEDNIRAVKMTKAAGIGVHGCFILGLPTETREESLATIRLAKGLPLDEAYFFLATPYPGTELYEIARSEGFDFEGKWDCFTATVGMGQREPVYYPAGRSPDEMKRLQRKAYLEFYLRPRMIPAFFNPRYEITKIPRILSVKIFLNYLVTFFKFIIETLRLSFRKKHENER